MKSTVVETPFPATADPVLYEWRCPNGHDSSIPTRCPALTYFACGHYATETTWNEFCITCGVRHEPFRIFWTLTASLVLREIPRITADTAERRWSI